MDATDKTAVDFYVRNIKALPKDEQRAIVKELADSLTVSVTAMLTPLTVSTTGTRM